MWMIAPPRPCATICLAAAWPVRKKPFRFTRTTRSKSSSSNSSTSAGWSTAALLIITSRPPWASTVLATSASTCARSPTSQETNVASPPASRRDCAAASPFSDWMSAMTTFAPSFANRRAHASPMPCAAPVTMADLPEWSMDALPTWCRTARRYVRRCTRCFQPESRPSRDPRRRSISAASSTPGPRSTAGSKAAAAGGPRSDRRPSRRS